ncbi:hypothetical protein C1752_02130 [Acaryochloris thomasi RCC1774]|uniref:DOMON-like domain-containing protein n=1 Tax=Acaryochloris thomasi RCC1774 TaxID=1764569 RepID=A0A2W1JV07_9CYAN|nr:DOMON-like domain-containing protein [Acaryochloris thomasi]PZD73594.1 hypothetical protein C1752_02130 [Acaryochloris thomasi RCC1774]
MTQLFELQPFLCSSALSSIQVKGELTRNPECLRIRYVVVDPLGEVVALPPSDAPSRQDDLWATTCLELFFGPAGSENYWEINLSTAGHWNVYRFDAYRSGMREEASVTVLPFKVERPAGRLHLSLDLDLTLLGIGEGELEVAIATVLQSKNNLMSYWALTHPGAEADFHRRDSFILKA